MKPHLRDHISGCLDDIPDNTTYEAGYLVSKNSGWRSKTPVINSDKCIGCLECYLYCPDGCIYRDDKAMIQGSADNKAHRERVAVDPDFCKGCGICAKVCPVNAILME